LVILQFEQTIYTTPTQAHKHTILLLIYQNCSLSFPIVELLSVIVNL